MHTISFDRDLVRRYSQNGPRYTSYPTALQFQDDFSLEDWTAEISASNADLIPKSLSIYVHIPFCRSLCYYCACNKIITQKPDRAGQYLDALKREIELTGPLFDADRQALQLHFGGGTPTFLTPQQLKELVDHLEAHFNLPRVEDREWSIEIDPRTVDDTYIATLQLLGFNRLSLGIQDFDPAVQAAVNRRQSPEMVNQLLDTARKVGFQSTSFDLIYGLPRQSIESFSRTLSEVMRLKPERIAVYNYAHLPDRFKAQRLIKARELPDEETRLGILELTIRTLQEAGYVYIGMDHFALPDDSLARAYADGTLQRNFQGYSTCGSTDLIGLGVSAISKVRDSYSQNQKSIRFYEALLAKDVRPHERGYQSSEADRMRADIIQQIMCKNRVCLDETGSHYGIDAGTYFDQELQALTLLHNDALVEVHGSTIEVTDRGRLLLRHIARVFDEYNRPSQNTGSFSRMI